VVEGIPFPFPALSDVLPSLTPLSRDLLEKLTVPQLVRTFLTFYATRRFITVFTTARHLSLLSTRRIQYTPPSHLSNSSLRDKNSPPPLVFHLHPPRIRLNSLLTSLPYFEWYSHNTVTGNEERILGHCYCPFC